MSISPRKAVTRLCVGLEFMSLLLRFLKNDFYWIGLRNKSGWRWEDGSPLKISSIVSNSLIQKCGAINQHHLQAASCEALLPWICKKVRL
ncbi:killer cell lectin-like receptor subfamily G member 1 [Mustela nigripes]|uniref:killer cell lectin-like receptor subfamily G member 1 n=1 Tax=Mustela nigripes TaxID=77151 RepID=UPI002816095F|nr:killer cell lectin-like receptor subfamily G member 1 [Mustela nigripes]